VIGIAARGANQRVVTRIRDAVSASGISDQDQLMLDRNR
jgi:hypothetical protein